jgi:hypothetical protein
MSVWAESQWYPWLQEFGIHVVCKREEKPDHWPIKPNRSQVFPHSSCRTVLICTTQTQFYSFTSIYFKLLFKNKFLQPPFLLVQSENVPCDPWDLIPVLLHVLLSQVCFRVQLLKNPRTDWWDFPLSVPRASCCPLRKVTPEKSMWALGVGVKMIRQHRMWAQSSPCSTFSVTESTPSL